MNYIVNTKCEIFISQLHSSALVWCEGSPVPIYKLRVGIE